MSQSNNDLYFKVISLLITVLLAVIGYFAKIGVDEVQQIKNSQNNTSIAIEGIKGEIKVHDLRIYNLETKKNK